MQFRKVFTKLICVLLTAIIFCVCFSSCRGGSGKSINWLLKSSPRNLDPQTASLDSELLIIKNCFSGLFEKGANGELYSSFVKHYDVSESGKRYVFHLYDDKMWSIYRGRKAEAYAPVTARDFEFAIKRLFSDNPEADVMRVLSDIKNADKVLSGGNTSLLGVSCPDDLTLTIDLKEKNPALLEAFTSHQLFPCNEEFFKSTSGRYGLSGDLLIFNGSFCISAWGESSVRLLKNPQSPQKVSAAGVTLYLPKSTREAVSLLKEGDIDAALLDYSKMDSLSASGNFNVSRKTSAVWALVFNESDALWQNSSLRSAVLYCTDRAVFEGSEHLQPANRLISDTAALFSENYTALTDNTKAADFNPEKAKGLYRAALSELEMHKIYNTGVLVPDIELCRDSFSALNQVFQRELSLYFSPEYLSEEAVLKKVKSCDFSAALVPLYITADTPSSSLEFFSKTSPLCILPITNAVYADNFSKAQTLSTAAQAAESYAKAEQALYDSALINPLFFESSYFVSSKSVSGFSQDIYGSVLFKDVIKK